MNYKRRLKKVYNKIFRPGAGKIIVEVGANQGNDTFRLAEDGATVYAFEPTRELVQKLCKKFDKYHNIKLLPFAIDTENGFKKFNVAGQADWGCSSFYEFNDNLEKKWPGRPDFKFTHSYEVPTITLFDFCEMYKIEKIDYLWIDTQGNDFNVLKSLGSKIDIVKAGQCEAANTVELYKKTQNKADAVSKWLVEKGFEISRQDGKEEVNIHFKRKTYV